MQLAASFLARWARALRLGTNLVHALFVVARTELIMTEKREYQLLTRDFARKDGIARVTGREVYSVDGNSGGVAGSNAGSVCIPVNEVV